jgi:thymidylate kinase
MEGALADEPDAWRRAEIRAVAWKADYALRLLKAMYERDGRASALVRWRALIEQYSGSEARGMRGWLRLMRALLPRWLTPRFRRTYVVTFSGLDGSGKSTQARLLRDALRAMGQDAVVVWAGIGTNRSLRLIKTPIKRTLRLLPHVGPFKELARRAASTPDGKPHPLAEPGAGVRRHGAGFALATQVWMIVMALANVCSLRKTLLRSFGKGRVIIFDRYTLDSAVRLQHWYGSSLSSRLVIWLVRLLNKRPLRAYFLEAPPRVVFDRKPEWELHDFECRATLYDDEYARLGVRRLDGTRPVEDLFAEIASDVWSALR